MIQAFALLGILALITLATFFALRSGDSQLAYLPGPPSHSWIIGNQADLLQSEAGVANRMWQQAFGNAYRFHSCFGIEWLMLNDPKAIAHVLQGQTTSYHLEESLREFLRMVTGKGIIYADGRDHARQRRLLQPAFSPSFVRQLTPQFADCAFRVGCDVLRGDDVRSGSSYISFWKVTKEWSQLFKKERGVEVEVNMYEWSERLTMEAIGQSAFGERFGIIEGGNHELAQAYKGFISTAFSQPTKIDIALQALALHIPPWLLFIVDLLPVKRIQTLKAAKTSSLSFAKMLIRQRRLQEDSTEEDRDILSILSKASEEDMMGKFSRMPEEEIYAQLTTLFVAGYETSCNTLTFALYEIARNPDKQERLHAEVAKVLRQLPDISAFDHSALEEMHYLQAVVKETLRLHAVVAHGIFKAGKNDTIPLSKETTTRQGDIIDAIPVLKGQRVFLSFDGVNRSQDIWGPEANDFNPERWLDNHLNEPPSKFRCGGPYANLANFGGGPKTCIAWRFAVIELQTFIAVLVSKFRFRIDSKFQMRRDGCHIVVTPTERGQENRGPRMPLLIEARMAAVP